MQGNLERLPSLIVDANLPQALVERIDCPNRECLFTEVGAGSAFQVALAAPTGVVQVLFQLFGYHRLAILREIDGKSHQKRGSCGDPKQQLNALCHRPSTE